MVILLLYQKSMDVAVCQQSFIYRNIWRTRFDPPDSTLLALALHFSKPEYLYSVISTQSII